MIYLALIFFLQIIVVILYGQLTVRLCLKQPLGMTSILVLLPH